MKVKVTLESFTLLGYQPVHSSSASPALVQMKQSRFAKEHQKLRPPRASWRYLDCQVPGWETSWLPVLRYLTIRWCGWPWVPSRVTAVPSLMWLQCIGTFWMIKSLMPSIGLPFGLTWIQSNTSGALCISVATDWPGAGQDALIRVWEEIHRLYEHISAHQELAQMVSRVHAGTRPNTLPRHMSSQKIGWLFFTVFPRINDHFRMIICCLPVFYMFYICFNWIIAWFVYLTGCGLMSWSACGRLCKTFPAGSWWVVLLLLDHFVLWKTLLVW